MRGTHGPMDIITRAEFDDSMSDFPTKDNLKRSLAETRSEIVSTVREALKENLEDLKVDLFAEIEEKVTRSHNVLQLGAVKASDLKDAKVEILATIRRDLGDAVAPLATKAEFEGVKSEIAGVRSDMEHGFLKMESRLDAMEHKINTVVMDGYTSLKEMMEGFTAEMRVTVKHHERRLNQHDADLYKLRQSGVLS
jgi:hypothetical protein